VCPVCPLVKTALVVDVGVRLEEQCCRTDRLLLVDAVGCEHDGRSTFKTRFHSTAIIIHIYSATASTLDQSTDRPTGLRDRPVTDRFPCSECGKPGSRSSGASSYHRGRGCRVRMHGSNVPIETRQNCRIAYGCVNRPQDDSRVLSFCSNFRKFIAFFLSLKVPKINKTSREIYLTVYAGLAVFLCLS